MEFDVELKGSGTAGTAPALGKLLKACGFGETVSAGTSVTYKPASSSISSITLGMYADGIHYQMWGCRGDVSLKLEAGKPGMLHFVFTGADFSVTTLAMLSSGVAYESTLPIPFQTATMTIDSYAALIGTMEFRLGNTVTLRPSVNASSGNFSAVITKRNPTLSIDPEEVIIATQGRQGISAQLRLRRFSTQVSHLQTEAVRNRSESIVCYREMQAMMN
jgi:hypothetical protein